MRKRRNLNAFEEASKYRKKHGQKYVCPFCDSFLIPYSWDISNKDGEVFEQYTCRCNGKSPSWYVKIVRQLFGNSIVEASRNWSYLSKKMKDWGFPKDVPELFNPSMR